MGKDLFASEGTSSDEVTTETNTTGVLDPILRVEPTRGQFIKLRNRGPRGKRTGIPIYMDLRDSNDDQLPADTEVAIAYLPSGADQFEIVSDKFANITTYRLKTLTEQQNEDNVDSVKHELTGASVNVRDVDDLLVVIDSSTQIDHSNSTIQFEPSNVEEDDMGR
jgi:hypothetical protein